MNSLLAFTIVMLIWTISDYVSKKTKALLSSLFVATVIFLIGFKSGLFPEDLLPSSSLLTLGQTVVGLVIVHLGTLISLDEFKRQWKTFVIGVSAVLGIAAFLYGIGQFFLDTNYVLSAIAAISGGTISIILVQDAAVRLHRAAKWINSIAGKRTKSINSIGTSPKRFVNCISITSGVRSSSSAKIGARTC